MSSEPAAAGAADPPSAEGKPQSIDIKKLADKVYQLMLEDIRLERARGARPVRRKGQP